MATATLDDAARVLAALPEDAEVTVTVKLGDWLRARELVQGGPEVLTTRQAQATFGFTSDQWMRWAKAGRIAGAWQTAVGGPWRLPREACANHVRRLQREAEGWTDAGDPAIVVPPSRTRSRARGPRRRAAAPAFSTERMDLDSLARRPELLP